MGLLSSFNFSNFVDRKKMLNSWIL